MTTIAPPPQAPSAAPPPLTPGGRSALRAVLVIAAVVLVVGTAVSLVGLAVGVGNFRVVADSKGLPPTMRTLILETGSVPAAVRITTDRDAREPRADLRMVNSTRAGDNPLSVSSDGTEARITINGESTAFLQWGRAGEIKVVLPPDLARRLSVTTRQDTGAVIAQADLDQLIAHNDDGAVVLSGSARRVEIHNVNGSVVSRDPISVSESFSATTENGAIAVDFAEAAPGTVDVESDNGDIVVGLPSGGPYAVDASTDNGDTSVRVPRVSDRDKAETVVTARSENGDVVIDDV